MNLNRIIITTILILTFVSLTTAQTEETAQDLISQKRFEEARSVYSTLAEKEPERTEFKVWVARLSSWIGDYEESIRLYDDVIKADGNRTEAYVGKAYVHIWTKNVAAAAETFESVPDASRQDVGVLIAKVSWLRSRARYKDARDLVTKALTLHPENVELIELQNKLKKESPVKFKGGCNQNYDPITESTTVCNTSVSFQRDGDKITGFAETGKRLGANFRAVGIAWSREYNTRSKSNIIASFDPNGSGDMDFTASFDQGISQKLNLGIDARLWRINGENIKIVSPRASYKINQRNVISSTFYISKDKTLLMRYDRNINDRLNTAFVFVNPITGVAKRAFTAEARFRATENIELFGSYGFSSDNSGGLKNLFGWGFTITK